MAGLTNTTAAQGTLRAIARDAEGVENDAYGRVGTSIDFLSGEEGTAFAEGFDGTGLASGVVETDQGGQGVMTRDGEVVGFGPTPDGDPAGDGASGSTDGSDQATQRIIALGGDQGGMLSSPLMLVALAALGVLVYRAG